LTTFLFYVTLQQSPDVVYSHFQTGSPFNQRTTFKQGGLMGNALNSKHWLFAVLCNAIMLLLACMTPSWAALLKDIRTGEYETYTRIVFELDSAVKEPVISQTAEQVQVVLSDTQPDLKRRLPPGVSRHLQDIKIQTVHPDKMSIIIQHGARISRISAFELHSPPRLVLDAHWATSEPTLEPRDALLPSPVDQEPLFAAIVQDTPPIRSLAPPPLINSPMIEDTPGTQIFESEPLPFHVHLPGPPVSSDDSAAAITTEYHAPPPVTSVHHLNSGPKSHPFQIFLAIVLVTIIIAILVFMALMLLCRNHWIHFDETSRVSGYISKKNAYITRGDTSLQEDPKT
jgi:hypothetical protein